MSDQYEGVRALSFSVVAPLLGADLSLFKLRKNGHEYYGPCPVHKPKNNKTSFSYADDGKFNCFSCGAKGRGSIDLMKLAKGIGFQQAVELLEGVKPPPAPEKPATNEKSAPGEALKPYSGKYEKFKVACPWLEARIPDAGVRERYGVFCYDNPARKSAYSGRVMLPVRDMNGVLYGYLGRDISGIEGQVKYLFPPNLPKSRFLFGSFELSQEHPLPVRYVYLVESPFCVMKFASLGLPAVSPFGWSISDTQIEFLQSLTKGVIFLPDDNKRSEASAVLPRLAQNLWLRFPELPAGVDDPEHLSLEQIQALTH